MGTFYPGNSRNPALEAIYHNSSLLIYGKGFTTLPRNCYPLGQGGQELHL